MIKEEARLAVQAGNGDRNAFATLVGLYKDKIFQLGIRMLGSRQEAEEIVQETFIRVYLNISKYNSAYKFSTWIYRIASNLCIDTLRKRKHSLSLDAGFIDDDDSDAYSMIASNEKTPEAQVIVSEAKEKIRSSVDQLPEKYRVIVILRYFHDMSLQEISEILDMPVTTVKTRVHRGREYLRRKLSQDQLI